MYDLPRSPAASHSFGPSVTPGMGAKVADTKVAMLMSVSMSKFVLLSSTEGAGAGVGEETGDNGPGRVVVISGRRTSVADVVLFSDSEEGRLTLTGGRAVLTVLGCGIRGFPGTGPGSVLTEVNGGVVDDIVSVAEVLIVEGGIVLMTLGWGVETFPGAGGGAVFRELSSEVFIFPAGNIEAVLEAFGEGVGILPDRGAGAVLAELGLEVVVVFLIDGGATDFAFVGVADVFLGCGVFVGWPEGG